MASTWLDFPTILVIVTVVLVVIALIVRYLPPPTLEVDLNNEINQLRRQLDEQEKRLSKQDGVVEKLSLDYREALEEMAEVNRIARIQAETIAELRKEIADLHRTLNVKQAEASLHILGVWPFPDIDLNTSAEEYAIYNSGFYYRTLREQEATKEGVALELRRHPYTLLEVGSHGDENGIRLYDDVARPGWWVRLFNDYPTLQVVLLLACTSDRVGDALIEAGVPVVVSVQKEISDRHVGMIVRNFYLYLAKDYRTLDDTEKAVEFARNLLPEKAATLIRVRTNFKTVRGRP